MPGPVQEMLFVELFGITDNTTGADEMQEGAVIVGVNTGPALVTVKDFTTRCAGQPLE